MAGSTSVCESRLVRVLVAVAIIIVLGHICALPTHAHPPTGRHDGAAVDHHATNEPSGDGASCEATLSKSRSVAAWTPTTPVAPLRRVVVTFMPALHGSWSAVHLRSASSLFGPPLFLLHATLLI